MTGNAEKTVMNIGLSISLAAVCLLAAAPAAAQKSAFQSGNGQTSLYLDGGSAVTANFADTKVSLGQVFRQAIPKFTWGYEAYFKASSGSSTLFSSKIKVPEGGADVVVGWHPLVRRWETTTRDNWLLFDIGYSRSAFYVAAAPPGSVDDAKRYFDRIRAIAAYNHKFSDNVLLGVAAGAERRNNLDDLTEVKFQTAVAPAPAGGSVSAVKSKDGFLGDYREYVAAPVYTDLLYLLTRKLTVLKSRVAIDGFTRFDVAAPHRSADGGVGIFLTDPKKPTRVRGGLSASWNEGKVRVALVASYNF